MTTASFIHFLGRVSPSSSQSSPLSNAATGRRTFSSLEGRRGEQQGKNPRSVAVRAKKKDDEPDNEDEKRGKEHEFEFELRRRKENVFNHHRKKEEEGTREGEKKSLGNELVKEMQTEIDEMEKKLLWLKMKMTALRIEASNTPAQLEALNAEGVDLKKEQQQRRRRRRQSRSSTSSSISHPKLANAHPNVGDYASDEGRQVQTAALVNLNCLPETESLFVLVFYHHEHDSPAKDEQTGIYSLQEKATPDELPVDTILAFMLKDDAERYSSLLNASKTKMGMVPIVESVTKAELALTCHVGGHRCVVSTKGYALAPPDDSLRVQDWERSNKLQSGAWRIIGEDESCEVSSDEIMNSLGQELKKDKLENTREKLERLYKRGTLGGDGDGAAEDEK